MAFEQRIVLVVDDEAAVRRFIALVLRRIGCKVLEAANAMDALEVFRIHSHLINLAIIDFVMPSVSGLDLAAESRPAAPRLEHSLYLGIHRHSGDELRCSPAAGRSPAKAVQSITTSRKSGKPDSEHLSLSRELLPLRWNSRDGAGLEF